MSSNRRKSPWAIDESKLQCPSCKSTRVTRVINPWALARGILMFKCSVCGKVFYDKDADDYRPTFER
ncbi:MAG: hypothetical protein C4K48_10565 [Candidatus Thorarchaeota archaeon]|nr:MAG: hypothetical protein C4K48_10565 [Candidatus Thorarchaeota archaeon]